MDLTIILPTYNRPKTLVKLYKFYRNQKIDKYFIIIDGSLKKNLFFEKNKKYFHKPYLDRRKRIEYVLRKVKTKFVCIAADDDFYIFKNIKVIIKNMIVNNSQIGKGITYNFYINKKNLTLKKKSSSIKNFDRDAFQNLRNFIQEKNIFFTYCIFKTNFFKKIFKITKKYSFIEFELNHEIFITLYSLIFGKVSYTNKIYNLRQQSNNKVGLKILYNYPIFFRLKNFFKMIFFILKIYPAGSKINFLSLLKICNLKYSLFPRKNPLLKILNIYSKKQNNKKNFKNLTEYKMLKKFYKV